MPSTLEPIETTENLISPQTPKQSVIGWQGVRFTLPPDWNLTGFSMSRESGYLRVDAPGNSAITVQVRWTMANKPETKTLYHALAPKVRKLLKKPEPKGPKPDLKASLEKMLKESQKAAKKEKSKFESNLKPEKTEGEHDERTSVNFTWQGAGRGQGKIWHCEECGRLVVAQVVGLNKDTAAMNAISSLLFQNIHCHDVDGWDRWALYDCQVDVPKDFRLESQKLLSGFLSLTFGRGAEKIIVNRWGLANMTLKKFTPDEWFRGNASVNLKAQKKIACVLDNTGHEVEHYRGKLSLPARAKALKEGKLNPFHLPTRYAGGCWVCPESNRLYTIEVWHREKNGTLWDEVAERCLCH